MPVSTYYTMKYESSSFLSVEQKQQVWKELKQKAGLGLYELLDKSINPTVVEIREFIMTHPIPADEKTWMESDVKDELKIEVAITPVATNDVKIYGTPDYYKFPIGFYRWTFWNRLQWVITGRLPK